MSSDNMEINSYVIKLFVTGNGIQATDSVKQIRHLLDNAIAGTYDLNIIDVLQNPAKADEDDIIATPTLFIKTPRFERRIIGRLSDQKKVLDALNFKPSASASL